LRGAADLKHDALVFTAPAGKHLFVEKARAAPLACLKCDAFGQGKTATLSA
jgi:hypothetical protein